MIYHCFCRRVEINWNKFSFSIRLVFFSVTFSVIWYLKLFVLFKRSLNESLILDLIASNYSIGSFFQLIEICNLLHILLIHDLFLVHSILHKKESQKANQCFLSV